MLHASQFTFLIHDFLFAHYSLAGMYALCLCCHDQVLAATERVCAFCARPLVMLPLATGLWHHVLLCSCRFHVAFSLAWFLPWRVLSHSSSMISFCTLFISWDVRFYLCRHGGVSADAELVCAFCAWLSVMFPVATGFWHHVLLCSCRFHVAYTLTWFLSCKILSEWVPHRPRSFVPCMTSSISLMWFSISWLLVIDVRFSTMYLFGIMLERHGAATHLYIAWIGNEFSMMDISTTQPPWGGCSYKESSLSLREKRRNNNKQKNIYMKIWE